jgi:hypothetical protein
MFHFSGFFSENVAICEIMWKNIVTLHMTVWRMRIACWVPKATNTHSQYVILVAFPLQQWLHERASLLRYTYISAPVLPYLQNSALGSTPARHESNPQAA